MRNDTRDWLFRVFKLLVIVVLIVMLTQPETCAFAMYFLDANMLDVFVLLLQAQIVMMLMLFFRYAFARRFDQDGLIAGRSCMALDRSVRPWQAWTNGTVRAYAI